MCWKLPEIKIRIQIIIRSSYWLVSDGCGARAAYHYDSQGNKTEETFKISDEVDRVIHYHYDAVGNLTEKTEGIEERF